MTEADFLALLDGMNDQTPVRASEMLADHHEVEIGDTLICLRWSDDGTRIDLTVPLPELGRHDDDAPPMEALYRLLLQYQWVQGDSEGVAFGIVPELDDIVGMVSLDAQSLGGTDELLQALSGALADVQAAWFEIGTLWLLDGNAAERQARAGAGQAQATQSLLRA